jgi:hypothetical protein
MDFIQILCAEKVCRKLVTESPKSSKKVKYKKMAAYLGVTKHMLETLLHHPTENLRNFQVT